MLPFGYAIRNLLRDPMRLLQAVLGSALVVLMVMTAAAINNGMTGVLSASGSAGNVILLGAGSEESVLRSEISERVAGIAESSLTGLKETAGVRAVSPEVHQMVLLGTDREDRKQAFVRGVTSRALMTHETISVTDGFFIKPGQLMVGRLAWRRLGLPEEALQPGKDIWVEDTRMTIAGIFTAPGFPLGRLEFDLDGQVVMIKVVPFNARVRGIGDQHTDLIFFNPVTDEDRVGAPERIDPRPVASQNVPPDLRSGRPVNLDRDIVSLEDIVLHNRIAAMIGDDQANRVLEEAAGNKSCRPGSIQVGPVPAVSFKATVDDCCRAVIRGKQADLFVIDKG